MISEKYQVSGDHIDQTNKTIDTLIISNDHTLFLKLSSFFKEFEPNRTPILADSLPFYSTIEGSLNHCETILYDMRSSSAVTDLTRYILSTPPNNAFSLGIAAGQNPCDDLLALPANYRLAGFINLDSGWRAVWHQILAIKAAWYNPQIISRIEEVPVGEILQMISCNRWNSNVFIDGTLGSSPSTEPLRGCISFFRGEPHTAWSWRNAGNEAIFDLLSVKQGVLQVIKNHGTPVFRNIYHHTDELILSHAVALDESSAGFSFDARIRSIADSKTVQEAPVAEEATIAEVQNADEKSAVKNDDGKPAVAEETDTQTTWWHEHGGTVLSILDTASARTFPLRWMTEEAFCDLKRTQPDSSFLLFYGSDAMLISLFSQACRGFSSGKFSNKAAFPVMRIGGGNSTYLYIAGINYSRSLGCAPYIDAFTCISENETVKPEQLINKKFKTLQLFTDSENNTIFESIQTSPPVYRSCTFKDWASCAALLSTVVSSLMQ